MRYYKIIFSTLFLLVTININAQKKGKVFAFQYNGQTFEIAKGDKIHLGIGSNRDQSFALIERDKVIRKREHYSNNRGSSSDNDTDIFTGEKEYLREFYSNKIISIKKVKYYKKMDQYHLHVFTTDRIFTLHIEEAINRGEVIGINGVSLGNENAIRQSDNHRGVNEEDLNVSNDGLNYILYLKNGSEIKCNVLEIIPNDYIEIETFDKSTFVFSMDEIKELKEIVSKPFNNTNNIVTSATSNNFSMQPSQTSFNAKKDTTPIGSFYNTTELSYYIPNSTLHASDYTAAYGGINVRNMSGYVFKDYLFIGAGIGYGAYFANNKEQYHALYFGLNQRLFALGNKRISPTVSLHQNFGVIVSGVSPYTDGAIQEYDFNFGARFTVRESLYLTTTVGYAMQLFKADILTDNGYRREDLAVKANYFSVNVAIGFKK